ncbi:MAG: GntR family transcriptional regulator [Hyphomicrobiales bacterium]|nr:GntR family transcriptional regulator [Hyphomicrobiales bacterium]MCP5373678.1 GntR family transcriptional regulator [Hyphomicrobiales bacterium]
MARMHTGLRLTAATGPLYVRVREGIVKRIAEGHWVAGHMLPSEIRLGQEFGVSQGTVRKALDELAAANIVVRRQGKGTFVATHTHERALFHFFHLNRDDGTRELPESRVLSCRRRRASRLDAARLRLPADARVIVIERVRDLMAQPAIAETVILPEARFPGLGKPHARDLPNTLYQLYQERYGVTVARAVEHLRAVAADAADSRALGVPVGTPLLEIERLALTLDGAPVELRLSRCDTAEHYYESVIE